MPDAKWRRKSYATCPQGFYPVFCRKNYFVIAGFSILHPIPPAPSFSQLRHSPEITSTTLVSDFAPRTGAPSCGHGREATVGRQRRRRGRLFNHRRRLTGADRKSADCAGEASTSGFSRPWAPRHSNRARSSGSTSTMSSSSRSISADALSGRIRVDRTARNAAAAVERGRSLSRERPLGTPKQR
jgi:hypothetical protein